jgi:predicted RNase H-like HicB family nuclease
MARTITYPVRLTPAEEGGYIATSPVISMYTQGDTEEEALANAKEAILCHVEGMAKAPRSGSSARVTLLRISLPDFLES